MDEANIKKIGDFILTIEDDDEQQSNIAAETNKNETLQNDGEEEVQDDNDDMELEMIPVTSSSSSKTMKKKKNGNLSFFAKLGAKGNKGAIDDDGGEMIEGIDTKWAPIDDEERMDELFDETRIFKEPLDEGNDDSDSDSDDGSDDSDEEEEEEEENVPGEHVEDSLREYMPKVKKARKLEDGDDSDSDSDSDSEGLDGKNYDREFFQEEPERQEDFTRTFAEMNISRPLLKSIDKMGYEKPTPIQARCIPVLLRGDDMCASAQTGSGKTAAFMLPILERLVYRNRASRAIRVLVLLPTRELARQCYEVTVQLTQFTDITSCVITGGKKGDAQKNALLSNPDIVIATPGRIVDHLLNTPSFGLETLEILVLDEADRLLELGFEDELQEIIDNCPKDRQTMLFSATMTDNVSRLISLSLNKPVRISIDSRGNVAEKLRQEFIRVRNERNQIDKEAILLSLCTRTYSKRVIIFTNFKHSARRLRMLFYLRKLKAAELHSDLTQVSRLRELDCFARGEADFLICTDVASRGLDIKDVQTVINYDMPNSLKTYIHRVGRTARAGKSGIAVSFTSEAGRNLLKKVVKRAKARNEDVQQRVVPPEAIQYWIEKIKGMSDKIDDLNERVKIEKEMKITAQKIEQAEKMLHRPGQSKILSKPSRKWIDKDLIKKEVDEEFDAIVREEKQKVQQALGKKARRKRRREETENEGQNGRGKKQLKRDLAREKRDATAGVFLNKYQSAMKQIRARNARR